MTPKETAISLVEKYIPICASANLPLNKTKQDNAKACAIIAVDEIIDEMQGYLNLGNYMQPSDREIQTSEDREIFWQEVKKQIELIK